VTAAEEVVALKARVAELEQSLAVAEGTVHGLRALLSHADETANYLLKRLYRR